MKNHSKNPAFFKQQQQQQQPVKTSTSTTSSLSRIFRQSRVNGHLNLSDRKLNEIPNEVFQIDALEEGEKYWEIIPLTKIDLSFNNISIIQSEINIIEELLILKLRDNKLNKLPLELFHCIKINHLDIGNNKLDGELNDNIGKLVDLQELYLFSNKLTSIPSSFGNCILLRILQLQDNKITELPEIFHKFTSITSINLSNNKISSLPLSFSELRNVKILEIKGNSLSNLPNLSKLESLNFLDASENKIENFPILPFTLLNSDGSSKMNDNMDKNTSKSNLDRLYLGNNRIRIIDTESLLSNIYITELQIHNNSLTEIPEEVGELSQLKVLDVSNNNLDGLPSVLGFMSALQKLSLEGNPIRTIRRTLLGSTAALKTFLKSRDVNEESGERKVLKSKISSGNSKDDMNIEVLEGIIRSINIGGELNLSKKSFGDNFILKYLCDNLASSHIFDSSMGCISLTSLNLSDNLLTMVSFDVFEYMPCLNNLILSSNSLGDIFNPTRTNFFPQSLKRLDISKNRLKSIHLEALISNLNLHSLTCSCNLIDSIPSCLNDHTSLNYIDFDSNKITSLSTINWLKLTKLDVIIVSNNKINSILELVNTSPHTLKIDNNCITELPPSIGYNSNLTSFNIYGNPQKGISFGLTQKGTVAILEALKSKCKPNEIIAPTVFYSVDVNVNNNNDKSNKMRGGNDKYSVQTKSNQSSSNLYNNRNDNSLNDSTTRNSHQDYSFGRSDINKNAASMKEQFESMQMGSYGTESSRSYEAPSTSIAKTTTFNRPPSSISHPPQHRDEYSGMNLGICSLGSSRTPQNYALAQGQALNQAQDRQRSEQYNTKSISHPSESTQSVRQLKSEIESLQNEMENSMSISTTKKNQLRKDIAHKRASLIRLEAK
jgi:Leucine-rich repeat (LRR) protein